MFEEPTDCGCTVSSLVPERIEVPFGITSSTHILDDNMVSMSSEPERVRINNRGGYITSIWLPHEKCRKRPVTRGVVVIGIEYNAIGHPAGDFAVKTNAVAAIDRSRTHPCLLG
jgi:hypothetical protein